MVELSDVGDGFGVFGLGGFFGRELGGFGLFGLGFPFGFLFVGQARANQSAVVLAVVRFVPREMLLDFGVVCGVLPAGRDGQDGVQEVRLRDAVQGIQVFAAVAGQVEQGGDGVADAFFLDSVFGIDDLGDQADDFVLRRLADVLEIDAAVFREFDQRVLRHCGQIDGCVRHFTFLRFGCGLCSPDDL